MEGPLFGAVEVGGTKVLAAVGHGARRILAEARIETTTPEITIQRTIEFFDQFKSRIHSIGVASFGPICIDRNADDWGTMLSTPKPGWSGSSFTRPLQEHFGVPMALDTDVNAAVLAEYQQGALQGVKSGAYITVGTGIGGGLIADGSVVHGALHPELGHIRVLREIDGDEDFAGSCPYHGDCLEGLASGPAIERRWGAPLSNLDDGHVAHRMVADYLGQCCATVALMISAGRIVIGGGVSRAQGLHARVAERMLSWLGGYLSNRYVVPDSFIVKPGLGDRSGLIGAMLLAERAHNEGE